MGRRFATGISVVLVVLAWLGDDNPVACAAAMLEFLATAPA